MKRYIAILLCMAVAAGVAACQPTPESSIVVGSEPNYTSADDKCRQGSGSFPR